MTLRKDYQSMVGRTMVKLLEKFGLNYYDLPTMLWNVGVLLRTLTINVNRKYNQPIPWIYYFTVIYTGICYFYVYIFSMVWFVLVRCTETGDFISAMVTISVTMCCVTCVPKMYYMKCHSDTMMHLVDDFLTCNELVVKGTRFEKNLMDHLRIVKKQATIAWSVLTINGVVYVCIPFFRPGRHFCQDLFVLYGLDPMVESPHYEIASFLIISAVYFSLMVMVHVTLFITVIVGFLEAQILALSIELTKIWEDSEKFYNLYHKMYDNTIGKNKLRNEFLKLRLRDIVKFHIMSINLRNNVERELRFIFVNDFIFMIFALVTELVGGLENTMVQFPFTIGIIFIDCYIGQRLIDAGTVFEDAIYSSKWENFHVSNQKTILYMLQSSQKTMSLSAGGIAILNFPYLMSVIRFAYSAYTTLKTSAKS